MDIMLTTSLTMLGIAVIFCGVPACFWSSEDIGIPNKYQTHNCVSFIINHFSTIRHPTTSRSAFVKTTINNNNNNKTMPSTSDLPDISTLKLSELKKELSLYGIDSTGFCEKNEFTAALKNARETLPRPTTTYHEVVNEPTEEEIREKEKRKAARKNSKGSGSKGLSGSSRHGSHHQTPTSVPAAAAAPSISKPQSSAPSAPAATTNSSDMKKALASRSPVTAIQQLKEHPSEKLLGVRDHSFLPGSPFSFALKGSIFESDSAIVRIPDGVCLIINSASVDRKSMETYLMQKGSIGVSLKVSSEENPQLLPIWTFDKERSSSYTVSDLGIEVCGPRTIRLMAWMEMGFRSGASVDVNVFGSVRLDRDKF